MNTAFKIGAVLAVGLGFQVPAAASTVVTSACVSVSDTHGCLFNGNINGNTNLADQNSYLVAQNAYNAARDPDISLSFITKSDDANFASFGSITGTPGSSGTWSLSHFLVDYIAVKAGPNFVLYKLATPASSGSWSTIDIPHNNNLRELSHLTFFGSAIPEPAAWAMMLGGFALVGATARRRTRSQVSYA